MTEQELAEILKARYDSAKRKEAALQVHLFGIEFGNEIQAKHYKISHLIELAGLEKGYAAEVSKGVKLASHVKIMD